MSDEYEIKAHKKFLEDIKDLNPDLLSQVYKGIEKLKRDPLRFKRLRGTNFYRMRIGKHRLIFSVSGKEVRLLIFGKRSRVYKRMKGRTIK